MYGYIYKTTNLINGKIYIGQKQSSKFLGNDYLGSGKILKKALGKYGIENFSVTLIEELNSKRELNEREIYWINFYNSRDKEVGYNIAFGGNGGDIYHSLSEKEQDKIKSKSCSNLGKICVTKEGHRKYILKEDLDYYISIGYEESQKYKHLKELEIKNKLKDELKKFEDLSWEKGEHLCKTCGAVMFVKYGKGLYCCKSCAVTHKHSDATKSKLANYNKQGVCGMRGKHLTEEQKKKHSISSKKYYASNNLVWVTYNNEITKRIKEEDLENYLLQGWVRGMKKGNKTPWNKGLTLDDPRVDNNIKKRNNTMLERYGTLNAYAINKNKGDE